MGQKLDFGGSRLRHYNGWLAWGIKALSALIPLYSIFFILNISGYYLRFTFFADAYLAIFLALILTLVFLLFPATSKAPRDRLPWYDVLFVLASLAVTIYRAYISYDINWGFKSTATLLDQAFFVILLLVLSEAVRRTVGLAVLSVVIIFIIYAYTAHLLPGLWGSPRYSWEDLTSYMYVFDSGIFGMILKIAGTVVILFVTFGAFMVVAGVGETIMDSAMALAGKWRGGPAKVAIVSSALMAMLSGSPVANVGTTGVISIPLMKKLGYKPYFAGAVEAVASTGGVLTPPVMGSVAFLMGELTGVGYAAVCFAAILPAVLYYVCVYSQLDFEAAKQGLVGLPPEELPSLKRVLKEGSHRFLPIIFLVVLMVLGFDVLHVVAYTLAVVIIVSLFQKKTRMGFKKIVDALASGTEGVLTVVPIMAAIGIVFGALTLTGLSVNLGSLIRELAGGNIWFLAILVWVFLYIAGTGVGQIATYLVMAVLVGTAFVAMGVPLLVAHMFIFIAGMSMYFTPPNCPVVFVACSISGAGMWKTAFQAMKLGLVAFLIPFLLLFDPVLMMIKGTPLEIFTAFLTACIAVIFLSAGVEGFLLKKVSWWQRILFIVGGLALFVPGWQTDVIGLVVLLIGAFPNFLKWRAGKSREKVLT